MTELFTEAFRLVNLPFTILLILVVLYWLLVAVGALGPGGDGDVDAHVEAGHDVDADHDGDFDGLHHQVDGHGHGHGHHEGSWWGNTLKFVNLGDVPAMVVLSVLILSMWSFGIIANRYWTGGSSLLAAGFLGINLVVSVIVTRYATLPLKPLFRMLHKQYDEPVKIVGQHCRIVTSEATPDFGQAEIATTGAPILIHVRTLNDAVLRRGDVAVVVREDADRRIFFITANPVPITQTL